MDRNRIYDRFSLGQKSVLYPVSSVFNETRPVKPTHIMMIETAVRVEKVILSFDPPAVSDPMVRMIRAKRGYSRQEEACRIKGGGHTPRDPAM